MAETTPALSRLCCRMLGFSSGRQELDDVLQDVYVRVWANRHRYRGDAAVSTWVTSVALNVCRGRLRRRKLWCRFLELVRPRQSGVESPLQPDGWPRVVQALNHLSIADKEVVVLHYLEERSLEEMAELLGVRKNTVEVRLHRARKRLRSLCEGSKSSSDENATLHRSITVV